MTPSPDQSIDLQFRPASYWDHTDPVAAILSGIKGQSRRDMVRGFVTGRMPAELGEIDPDLVANTLDEATRKDLGAAHPSWMGGEYLPDYLAGEVEIARIVLASATQDVISIRARRRRHGRRILYRIVDEHHEPGREPWGCRPASSGFPLTLGHLIGLIDGAHGPDFDLEDGTLTDYLRDMQERADPEDSASFVTVESDFYPSISGFYEGKAREWLERWR
jgi:hypothetical protein